MKQTDPIGIFDSGVGGVSVLATARQLLPREDYIYYADSAHAPYGVQSGEAVIGHSLRVANHLTEQGVKALIVACNTATSAAIQVLRAKLDIPVIGMEPALKPAALRHSREKIVVMATPLTLQRSKFRDLLGCYDDRAEIILLPAPRLVELVESGLLDGPQTEHYLRDLLAPHMDASALVLGCTHFIFVRPLIQKILPAADLVDGNAGTVRQLQRILNAQNLLNPMGGTVDFQTSGGADDRDLCIRLFDIAMNL